METTYNQEHKNPFKLFTLSVGLLAVLVIIGYVIYNNQLTVHTTNFILEDYGALTIEEIRILEVYSGHPWKHAADQKGVFDCFRNHGSTKSFRTSGFLDKWGNNIDSNVWLCVDLNGDWWALVTTPFKAIGENKVARLITFYKVTGDIFSTVDEYISYIARKWSAVPINYIIEAGRILLEPK